MANAENYALYTHNTFKITDKFNLIAGLRYQELHTQSSKPTTLLLPLPAPYNSARALFHRAL